MAETDHDVVKEAVSRDGLSLQWVATMFQGDRDIVEAAVKNNGNALRYASDELRGDPSVVLRAVRNNSTALRWAKGLPQRDASDLEVEALRQLKKSVDKEDKRYFSAADVWLEKASLRDEPPPADMKTYRARMAVARARMAVALGNRLATSFSEGMLVCIVLKTSVSEEEEDSLTVSVEVGFSAIVEFPGLPKETTMEELADRALLDFPTKQYARVLTVHGATAVPVLPENGRSLVTTLVPPEKGRSLVATPVQPENGRSLVATPVPPER